MLVGLPYKTSNIDNWHNFFYYDTGFSFHFLFISTFYISYNKFCSKYQCTFVHAVTKHFFNIYYLKNALNIILYINLPYTIHIFFFNLLFYIYIVYLLPMPNALVHNKNRQCVSNISIKLYSIYAYPYIYIYNYIKVFHYKCKNFQRQCFQWLMTSNSRLP